MYIRNLSQNNITTNCYNPSYKAKTQRIMKKDLFFNTKIGQFEFNRTRHIKKLLDNFFNSNISLDYFYTVASLVALPASCLLFFDTPLNLFLSCIPGAAGLIKKEIETYNPIFNKQIITEKDSNLSKEQKICKGIFLRDFSQEEAKDTQKKYQELVKNHPVVTKDVARNVFEELCKDFEIPANMIETDFGFDSKNYKDGLTQAYVQAVNDSLKMELHIPKIKNTEDFLHLMSHEFHHLKQYIIKHKALSNYEEGITVKACELAKCHNVPYKEALESAQHYFEQMNTMFNANGIFLNTLKGDSLYQYGRALVENPLSNNKRGIDYTETSIAEKTAHRAGTLMFDLLKNNN